MSSPGGPRVVVIGAGMAGILAAVFVYARLLGTDELESGIG